MRIRKKILSTVLSSGLMLSSAIALASMAQAGELLQPDSNWAVSKIAASSDAGGGAYCALARRFSNSTVLTLARNSRDESSMAIDFQKDAALDKNTTYYVVIKPGNGQERSFNVHPVSGRALVVRLGKDYPFYDALTRASQLDVKVAADTYSFAITDFDSGQQQLNGCLAALAEPAAGDSAPITSASMPVATDSGPTPLPSAEVAPQKPVRVASSAPVSDDQIQSLHEENVRLRKALEEERRSYENQILQQDKNSSVAAELTEKIDLLKHENDDLRQQAKAPSADAKAAASMAGQLKALQDENASLKQQTDNLTAEIAQANARQNDVNGKLSQTNAQMAAADKKASEAEEKLVEASQKLAQANQKSIEADQKLAQADQKLAQAGQATAADTTRKTDADRRLADATAKLDAANKKMLDADQKLALADQKLSDASQKAAQINQTLATNNQQQSEADQKLADANLKLDQANKKLADADQKLAAATQKSEQINQTVAQTSQQQQLLQQKLADANQKAADADRKLDDANRQLAAATQKSEQASQTVAQTLLQGQSLQQKLDAADQKAADADRKLDDANRQLAALTAEKAALQNQKIAQNTQAQTEAAQKLAAAQQALDAANKKVADANQKMAAAAAEQTAADKEKADLAMQKAMGQSATDQKTALANQKLDEASKRLAAADQKLNDANRELAAATAAKAALATQKVALNTQAQNDAAQKLAALQKKLDDANAKLSDASAKMAAADKEKADLAYQKTLSDSTADQKLAAANAKLEDANKRMAAADQKMAEATQKLAAKPVAVAAVSDNNKLADASQRLAQATQREAEAQQKLDEANKKSADADRKLADAAQKLAAADSKLVAAGRNAVNSPTPLPSDKQASDGIIASLKAQVSALEADNIRLKASLKTAQASPQVMSATTVSADSSVMQLHAVEEQLNLVQKERDRLANQIQGMSQGKDSHLMAISSNDWNLEEATKRYNEAEREIRRLGLQLEQDRGQCEADKKKIEYQLFDPAIATQAQIQKVNSLQQAVDKAQADLVAERSHVASLEMQLKGGSTTVALQSAPQTSSSPKVASTDSKPDASAKDLSAIMPAAGTPGPDMTPDLDSTGYRNTPAAPIQVSTVAAPGTISNRDGADEKVVSAPPPASVSPAVSSTPAVASHDADLSHVAGSAAAMVSGAHLATAADIQSLLGKSLTLKDGVTKVSGASNSGSVSYSWQSGALFGSAEQQTMGNPAAFDDHVAQYLAHTKSHCAGSFAAKPGETRTEGGVKVSAYEIACVGDSADASNASASLLFYSQNGVFTAIAHEGSLDDMDVAMDVRDQLLNKVLQEKLASN